MGRIRISEWIRKEEMKWRRNDERMQGDRKWRRNEGEMWKFK